VSLCEGVVHIVKTIAWAALALASAYASTFIAEMLFGRGFGALSNPAAGADWMAEKTAVSSPTHPLAGFWKEPDCSDRFGLAIAPAGHDYSVSFCGPGGCFAPGTYRRNTGLFHDPAYHIVDNDTIEIKGRDGFSTYVRCPSR
jgi:hypothetical protein